MGLIEIIKPLLSTTPTSTALLINLGNIDNFFSENQLSQKKIVHARYRTQGTWVRKGEH